jgi:putative ABC transport system permease protein
VSAPAATPAPAAVLAPSRSLRALAPEVLRMAVSSLRSHALRSLLTTLGVVFGVATVVAMASVINGFDRAVQSSISAFGTNVIYVRMFQPGLFLGHFPDSLRHREAFTPDDAQAIRDLCPDVKQVSVMGLSENGTITYGGRSARGLQVIGADPEIQDVLRYDPGFGRFFTREEFRRRVPVMVIGSKVRESLFPKGGDPLGKTVHLNSQPFVIIGELEPKGTGGGNDPDNLITIPYPTLQKLFPPPLDAPFYVPKRGRCYLNAVPMSAERTTAAVDEIRAVLRTRRHVAQNKPDDFAVLTGDSLTEIYNRLTGATFVVMLLISSIALMVGGIGVMNIMLVAVTERTREIGLRKAVGAPRASILLQFLFEAVMLTCFGGVLGILLGAGVAQLIRAVSPLPAYTPLWSVIVAFCFSVAVGVFFGFYPAMRASRLDPVEALRFE